MFDVGPVRLGDVICYEVGFDNLVRSEVTAGANVLALQSNDADFELDNQLGETEQQTAMARIRAIESDRAVVYASTTGESTIIAPDGSLVASSGIWHQAILDARVPLVTYRTLAEPGRRVAGVRDHPADRARAGVGRRGGLGHQGRPPAGSGRPA